MGAGQLVADVTREQEVHALVRRERGGVGAGVNLGARERARLELAAEDHLEAGLLGGARVVGVLLDQLHRLPRLGEPRGHVSRERVRAEEDVAARDRAPQPEQRGERPGRQPVQRHRHGDDHEHERTHLRAAGDPGLAQVLGEQRCDRGGDDAARSDPLM